MEKKSPPLWGRGLKHFNELDMPEYIGRPPLWGRGLKLWLNHHQHQTLTVPPPVGAWIETRAAGAGNTPPARRPPLWGRGLKLLVMVLRPSITASPPLWGRGLKQICLAISPLLHGRPPLWGRGLKREPRLEQERAARSPPPVGAWIKTDNLPAGTLQQLSPLCRAWIETCLDWRR